jgi:hypothetical protein
MARQQTPLPYERTAPYEQLISEFQRTVAEQEATVVVSQPVPSCFSRAPQNMIEFSLILHIKKWPCRKLGNQARLDVMITAREKLDRASWSLLKSTVYLRYLIVRDETADLVQSLHFDFQDPGQDCHPMFHAHLDSEPLPLEELQLVGFELSMVEREQPSQCWVTMRIPTSDMTLASVLFCLVAGHLDSAIFREFAERVGPIHGRLPKLGFPALKRSLRLDSEHFKSSHWFAHMESST